MPSPAPSRSLPAAAHVRDVGPRDGLQVEKPLPVAARVRLIRALVAAGVREIEVGAFVSPRAVPAMAGAAELLDELGPIDGVVRTALVPNLRGAVDAVAAGADALSATLSASEEYGRRNVRMGVDAALRELEAIAETARAAGLPVDAVVSCAFGSPYEGEIAPDEVARVVAAARAAGADVVTLADTTGMATPRGIDDVLDAVGTDVGLHLHETRGTALLCAYAGLQRGVTRFDTSLGGLGGSPFAEGAAGNLATEDLVSVLDDLGVESGISLPGLLVGSGLLRETVGHVLPSAVAQAGPRLPAATDVGLVR
ncbi:hydroxymethylglutaryl-CoA lyase [Patulibacter sp. SYSU D01012]|uniref:hydroxymethylglutaryl-CoA lyase n=1 Tax=Patulibacter sp. SYSU D01012 TaxID=2817381 RepID=UPI001B301B04|nr:hydroxymethylglutaryl-CoA lyase [Patulibacter sp. SYSU D01012]